MTSEMKPETRAELFLRTLVDSASSTARQSDVRRTHRLLADALQELGFEINWERDPAGKTDDLLVAERMPKSQNNRNDETAFITFVSHIDTVLAPADTGLYRRESTPQGLRARGAGIIDNKGGLAVLIESLRLLFETDPTAADAIGLRVVSSPDEETGSSAWHTTFREIGERSTAVLGFEPALDDGSIISSRRGNRWYNINVTGIEAHAGRCHGEELNAAHEAARITVRLLDARDRLRQKFPAPRGQGISLHIGHIEGGRDRHNVVCGNVRLKLDTRFSSFEERDALHQEIENILRTPIEKTAQGTLPTISYEIVDDCPPFAVSDKSVETIKNLCHHIAREESRTSLESAKAGGAGDVNHMSRPGLLVLDGLGPVGGRMHTIEEFIELSTLQTRAQALARWYPTLIKYLEQVITLSRC